MITQRIRVAKSTPVFVIFETENLFYNMFLNAYSPLPAWVTPFISGGRIVAISIDVSGLISDTEYSLLFTEGGSPAENDATLIVEVVDSLYYSLQSCVNFSSIYLTWITREGGRASMIFNQRIKQGIQIGDAQSFDNGGEIDYIFRGKNFDTRTVYKTGLSDSEVELINSLRYSIQAWEYNPDTDLCSKIYLNSESFDSLDSKSRLNEVVIKYRLSKYKKIQRQ